MIATRPFAQFLRHADRNALDVPVAALAGLSVAFAAFTIPGDVLADAVGASGVVAWLPAAEPPLGTTARTAIGAIGAIVAFAASLLLLRWLDRFGNRPERTVRMPAAAPEPETPRLRKRDLHPDAPTPRPISANRDFGEPAPPQSMPAPPRVERLRMVLPEAKGNLSELMHRLETGLARRDAAPTEPQPQPFPSASDDRLQSAIDSLQRLAARDF